ncbi:TMV resistance protein N isoform X1 [Cryptomeria japonica]|uniref:TMV resistance protein N isoform X1 n=1 Tax=Cryptomeria japonica TaxID=3369 RepID=UPI0025AB9D87|nr:TMV resistance protein N isoform X1 [Cryptomeria japonica]
MASSSTNSVRPENEAMAAFHEIAPSASTSSTLIQKPSYDVFINHRVPDVKKTLATRIYNSLRDMKVTAFLDSKELEYGDFLPATLEAAIRGATLHIAIFSESYAESPWCLAELSYMLKSGAKVIPVFYYVEPTDLRYVAQRKGKYVHAFDKHEEKGRYSPEKLQEWKDALYKVSFFTGEIIKNSDDEMGLLQNIVNIVQKEKSNVSLVVAKHPVGLDEAVEDFENTLQLAQGHQDVQIVGIWGMGGSGKTTLAKELYNRRCSSMERSSFIFDIREAKGMLQKKQIELLKGLGVDETFDNVEQGKAILARHLRSFRVLIVMDDVDHADQLDVLIPIKERLGKGSFIIVTTRECEVLTSWDISSVYKMRPLDPHNAKQLFCWYAFLQPFPFQGFEVLVKKFLEACHGLPLSLKVFGAQLCGNSSKEYWESLLHQISRILPKNIKEIFKVSYDALDDEEKEAFLDIACFFIGEKNSLVIEFWDGSGWSGLYIWKRLLNKCLVELDKDNLINMHDHLRDLGREISNQHSPSDFGYPNRLLITINKQRKKKEFEELKLQHLHMEYGRLFCLIYINFLHYVIFPDISFLFSARKCFSTNVCKRLINW